ncbi:MAG TPA: HEAT repeat domain-containing protein [Candidatus Acidoferrales bacterium]|nr:HEAT repeat domain-containing protein [Candidatus Acidoferrales bacterium]
MNSLFHWINAEAASFALRAIFFSLAGILLLVASILVRREVRRRYFDRLADAEFYVRQHWDEIVTGEISREEWNELYRDTEAIIAQSLDRIDVAKLTEAEKLLDFLRRTGLLDRMLVETRQLRGWKREAALVRLGRTRAPEAVASLAGALDDPNPDTQLAAVRGLARTGMTSAGEAMLERVAAGDLALPGTSLLNALIVCTRSNPRMLLPYLHMARGRVRELLARVMAEVASVELGDDLLLLASDTLPEVRASVARALRHADFGFAFPALAQLATDEEWYVRLRALTSLGRFRDMRALPILLHGVCDANRHVRQRAAEALAHAPDPIGVLNDVFKTGDTYALQAMIAELDRTGDFNKVMEELELGTSRLSPAEGQYLLRALEAGTDGLNTMMRLPGTRNAPQTV